MGRCPHNKKGNRKATLHKTAKRTRFLSKDILSRYFGSAAIREEHYKSKPHKKRAKVMKGPAPHTQADADWAGGMGAPDNGPRLRPSEVAVSMAM
ncbi:hypothetical protein CBR_g8310 [Chara braunii]|uniref:Uncharacterized protein n=1 Tax=Chara braunii TaxID=69332 RepID=A0A388KLU3_CHABU|nr:hypothetical protein CBR_g8310 [Chara braunii]|eukprot:GBG71012.1 hypothetical protein CBR_g8310 [Chara braunii]